MSNSQPPESPSAPPKVAEPASSTDRKDGGDAPTLEDASKKTSRLQWDEENLMSNAAEMERAGPRMKIDEPKTPFTGGSENGSSTSGSAHQSPPESPSFIPREQLVGFVALEQRINPVAGPTPSSTGNASDGASSAGSAARSVHISDDNVEASAGSSPRSRELFAARRKAHYRNEARVKEWVDRQEGDIDDGTALANATINAHGLRDRRHQHDHGDDDTDDESDHLELLRTTAANATALGPVSEAVRQNGNTDAHGEASRKPADTPDASLSQNSTQQTNGYADSVSNGHAG